MFYQVYNEENVVDEIENFLIFIKEIVKKEVYTMIFVMTNEMFKTNVPYLLDQPFEFSILKTKETQNYRITEHQKNRTYVVQIIHNHVTREEHVFVQFSGSINEGSIV